LPSLSHIWHDTQRVDVNEDGSINLTSPVAGFEEVVKEILRHGSGVEVLQPVNLGERARAGVEKMRKIGQKNATRSRSIKNMFFLCYYTVSGH